MAVLRGTLTKRLLRWYDGAARDLPWRRTRDPYHIWVSEIMLQQTRVGAVLEHYRNFVARFPSVASLASARESAVLAAWSGLGYYRRARALHAAAKTLVREHGGKLPQTVEGLRQLPGVGRYTAAAIASIAFGEKTAVVDGNVERVLRRVFALPPKSDAWEIANRLISAERPGDFNQAVMELGATVCLPGQPNCAACPIATFCRTKGPGTAARPVRRGRARLTYALARRGDLVLLVRRPAASARMPGMWELPEVEANGARPLFRLKHAITDTDYTADIVAAEAPLGRRGRWVPLSRAFELPLTGLCRKVLRRLCVI